MEKFKKYALIGILSVLGLALLSGFTIAYVKANKELTTEEQIDKLYTEVAALTIGISTWEADKAETEKEINQLNTELDAIDKDLETTRAKKAELESQIYALAHNKANKVKASDPYRKESFQ